MSEEIKVLLNGDKERKYNEIVSWYMYIYLYKVNVKLIRER